MIVIPMFAIRISSAFPGGLEKVKSFPRVRGINGGRTNTYKWENAK